MQEYADTSFLVSLYVFDANTAAANAYAKAWKRPPLLLFTPFSAFELNNTLRRVLQTKADLTLATKRIRSDFGAGIYVATPLQGHRLIDEADRVSRLVTAKHRARALDDLHLANARISGARVLLSFDKGQRAAALNLGLTVAPWIGGGSAILPGLPFWPGHPRSSHPLLLRPVRTSRARRPRRAVWTHRHFGPANFSSGLPVSNPQLPVVASLDDPLAG